MDYLYLDIKINNPSTALPPSSLNFSFHPWYRVLQAQNLILFHLPHQTSHHVLLIFVAIDISLFISLVPLLIQDSLPYL